MSPFLFAVYVDDLANLCALSRGLRIVLYADDILLLAPSISALESLLNLCECQLDQLDMVINNNKSCCIRNYVYDLEVTLLVLLYRCQRVP